PGGDDPLRPQEGEMLRQGRLAEPDKGGERCHRDLALLREMAEDEEPLFIGEHAEDGGDLCRPFRKRRDCHAFLHRPPRSSMSSNLDLPYACQGRAVAFPDPARQQTRGTGSFRARWVMAPDDGRHAPGRAGSPPRLRPRRRLRSQPPPPARPRCEGAGSHASRACVHVPPPSRRRPRHAWHFLLPAIPGLQAIREPKAARASAPVPVITSPSMKSQPRKGTRKTSPATTAPASAASARAPRPVRLPSRAPFIEGTAQHVDGGDAAREADEQGGEDNGGNDQEADHRESDDHPAPHQGREREEAEAEGPERTQRYLVA